MKFINQPYARLSGDGRALPVCSDQLLPCGGFIKPFFRAAGFDHHKVRSAQRSGYHHILSYALDGILYAARFHCPETPPLKPGYRPVAVPYVS